MERYLIVPLSALVRKSAQVVERRGVEAVGCEPAERLHASAPPLENAPGPLALRLERRETGVHRLGLEPLAFERVPNRSVAVAPPGKRLRTRYRHPFVVDEARPLERLERCRPSTPGSAAVRQPRFEPLPRQVPVTERPGGHAERVRAPQLTSERACRLAVECTPDAQAGAHDRVGGNGAPERAVEVDLDAPPRPLPQRRYDRNA